MNGTVPSESHGPLGARALRLRNLLRGYAHELRVEGFDAVASGMERQAEQIDQSAVLLRAVDRHQGHRP